MPETFPDFASGTSWGSPVLCSHGLRVPATTPAKLRLRITHTSLPPLTVRAQPLHLWVLGAPPPRNGPGYRLPASPRASPGREVTARLGPQLPRPSGPRGPWHLLEGLPRAHPPAQPQTQPRHQSALTSPHEHPERFTHHRRAVEAREGGCLPARADMGGESMISHSELQGLLLANLPSSKKPREESIHWDTHVSSNNSS